LPSAETASAVVEIIAARSLATDLAAAISTSAGVSIKKGSADTTAARGDSDAILQRVPVLSHIRSAAAAITSIVTAGCITAFTSGASAIEPTAACGAFDARAALAADEDVERFSRCNRQHGFDYAAVATRTGTAGAAGTAGTTRGNRYRGDVHWHDELLCCASEFESL
jgi:hypothetical protein